MALTKIGLGYGGTVTEINPEVRHIMLPRTLGTATSEYALYAYDDAYPGEPDEAVGVHVGQIANITDLSGNNDVLTWSYLKSNYVSRFDVYISVGYADFKKTSYTVNSTGIAGYSGTYSVSVTYSESASRVRAKVKPVGADNVTADSNEIVLRDISYTTHTPSVTSANDTSSIYLVTPGTSTSDSPLTSDDKSSTYTIKFTCEGMGAIPDTRAGIEIYSYDPGTETYSLAYTVPKSEMTYSAGTFSYKMPRNTYPGYQQYAIAEYVINSLDVKARSSKSQLFTVSGNSTPTVYYMSSPATSSTETDTKYKFDKYGNSSDNIVYLYPITSEGTSGTAINLTTKTLFTASTDVGGYMVAGTNDQPETTMFQIASSMAMTKVQSYHSLYFRGDYYYAFMLPIDPSSLMKNERWFGCLGGMSHRNMAAVYMSDYTLTRTRLKFTGKRSQTFTNSYYGTSFPDIGSPVIVHNNHSSSMVIGGTTVNNIETNRTGIKLPADTRAVFFIVHPDGSATLTHLLTDYKMPSVIITGQNVASKLSNIITSYAEGDQVSLDIDLTNTDNDWHDSTILNGTESTYSKWGF